LTITDKHTGGSPEPSEQYLEPNTLKRWKKVLKKFQEMKQPVYINTRGLAENIKEYLISKDIQFGKDELIKGIYGAKTLKEINPLEKQKDETEYNLRDRNRTEWGKIKANNLKLIQIKEGVEKADIYFYDDDDVNIKTASEEGYHVINVPRAKNDKPGPDGGGWWLSTKLEDDPYFHPNIKRN